MTGRFGGVRRRRRPGTLPRMRGPLALLAFGLLAPPHVLATEAPCAERPVVRSVVRVLVLDLRASAELKTASRGLSQVVAEQAARVSGFEIISSEEIRAVLDQEATRQLMGCDESSCLAELAGALDAELLVSGTLDATLDGAHALTLSLLNTRALVTMNRVSLTWRGDPARLAEVTAAAAQRLMLEKHQRPPGSLLVQGAPVGARVLVDGNDRSEEHRQGTIGSLEVGPHEVQVLAAGHTPRTEHVLVRMGEPLTLDGTLVQEPLTSRWWFWTGASAAVLASVGTTVAVLALSQKSEATASAFVSAPTLANTEDVKK
jgi:hypothetical protein